MDAVYGLDRRRRLSVEDANFLYVRANGRCEKCGVELGPDWHGAHGIAWGRGGATTIEQMQAQCVLCNLRNGTREEHWVKEVRLRDWQELAIPKLLEAIFLRGFATLHAAPGAGKTIAAAVIFKRLYDLGIVKRLVVIVPNSAIISQWRETLGRFRIHLDDKPRDHHIEHPDTVGLVTNYHTLRSADRAHALDFKRSPSMLIFDEVHHIAEHKSWGRSAQTVAGDIINGEIHPEAILNITGTLFRSGKAKRISVVRYRPVADGKIQAVADFSIPTAALIGRELRGVDVYVYGGSARLIDLREEQEITGEISDLDHIHRKAVLRNAIEQPAWRNGFVKEALKLHQRHLIATDYKLPLKILFVAAKQRHARLLADEINKVQNSDFARCIISDLPGSLTELRRAKLTDRPLAYSTVKMVTEGFDDPNISLLVYCSNVTAPLCVAQMMARGMRLTDFERQWGGGYLPMGVLIPDDPELRDAFAAALASTEHEVDESDADTSEVSHGDGQGLRLPRFDLLDLSDPRLNVATVLGHEDGDATKREIDYYEPLLQANGIPLVYTPRVTVVARQERPIRRVYVEEERTVDIQSANPRDLNLAHRKKIKDLSNLMAVHIAHDPRYRDIRHFQALANEAAVIAAGERQDATPGQLGNITRWMGKRLSEHYSLHCSDVVPDYVQDAAAQGRDS